MNLQARLARLDRASPDGGRGPSPLLRQRLDRVWRAGPGAAAAVEGQERGPLERFVPGNRRGPAAAPVYAAETHLDATRRHGEQLLERLGTLPPGPLQGLYGELFDKVTRPEQLAFLDTETTGLSGGAGTVPFLIGVGRWCSATGTFRVVQLFLEDLDREPAQLAALARELEGVQGLVTYNGASFDLPLLHNRHVLCRRSWPLAGVPHLDLLAPARSLWRDRHPDCRLTTLERNLLGHRRTGDIPGAEIPALYTDFLSRGATPRLAAVFRHNRDDIVTLALLLHLMAEHLAQPPPAAAARVGLLLARSGAGQRAQAALAQGLAADLPGDTRWRALRELGRLQKHQQQWDAALETWARMRSLDPAHPHPVEEAAKVLEHRLGDAAQALRLLDEALGAGRLWTPRDRAQLAARRQRLTGKLDRTRDPA